MSCMVMSGNYVLSCSHYVYAHIMFVFVVGLVSIRKISVVDFLGQTIKFDLICRIIFKLFLLMDYGQNTLLTKSFLVVM